MIFLILFNVIDINENSPSPKIQDQPYNVAKTSTLMICFRQILFVFKSLEKSYDIDV